MADPRARIIAAIAGPKPEQAVLKVVIECMMRDGYTLASCADSLGIPANTLHSWRARDPEHDAACVASREMCRAWLLHEMRKNIEQGDTRMASRALAILCNLAFPELRHTKQETTVVAAPDPKEARAKTLGLLNKAKPIDLDGV